MGKTRPSPAKQTKSPRGFADRMDAARQLAERLKGRKFVDPIVLGIPRGGVVLGAHLAEALGADLDVALARKLPMPGSPEFALGAIGEDGEVCLTTPADSLSTGLHDYVAEESRRQLEEIQRRQRLFRRGKPCKPLAGRSVIVVDDGIATGATMIAALHTLGGRRPREVLAAIPVASPDRLALIAPLCDEVVCLIEDADLHAVGEYYDDFSQVSDGEVIALLRRFAGGRAHVEK